MKSRHPKRAFFTPKVTIYKLKGKSVLFFFLYPFIFLSLPSFLYFLPVYLAWRPSASLVQSRSNKGDKGRILEHHFYKSRHMYLYMIKNNIFFPKADRAGADHDGIAKYVPVKK